MTDPPNSNLVTALLNDLQAGDPNASEKLAPMVYEALEQIARNHLKRERSGHTLDTSALVHEAYMKLVDQREANWHNRSHFFAIASQAMRRILVNYARKRNAEKRGGGLAPVTLEESLVSNEMPPEMLIALDEALERLQALSERQAQVVTMRFFGGLKEEEIATALDISGPTVRRDWRFAKAWLLNELNR